MPLTFLDDSTAVLLLAVLLLTLLYRYLTYHVGIWQKVGVPGPKPWPIVNHMPELRQGLSACLDKWRQEFGRTYGVYNIVSKSATLVTTDTKLLEQILVKDFANFADRHNVNATRTSMREGLFFVNGDKWRRSRHVTSRMFTGNRLKMMLQTVNKSASELKTLVLDSKSNNELIPLKDFAAKYTSDVIARIGFGLYTHSLKKEDTEFSVNIRNFFRVGTPMQNLFRKAELFFPWVMDVGMMLFDAVEAIPDYVDRYFVSLTNSSLARKKEERMKSGAAGAKSRDLLDLYLDVEAKDGAKLTGQDEYLTHKEIVGNTSLLVIAAFETTSSAIRSILYFLAKHPDVQDKVMQEIDDVLDGATEPEYDHLSQLKYTEQVINEALRMIPVVAVTMREVLETKTYDGVTIPKGTNVYVPIYKILQDPEYWPEPAKFDPERFSPANKSNIDNMSFLPFGQGPRLCVGKRLALMEIKVVLCQLLSSMRFVLTDRTEPKKGCEPVMINLDVGFILPAKPFQLEVELRNN